MIIFLKNIVYKIFLFILTYTYFFNICFADINNLPKYSGFVNDFTNTLSFDFKKSLEKTLSEFEKKTSIELVVVIIETTNGYPIEQYSLELARKWGIGKKDKNNGILILIAKNDRKIRIEVGYGLEGILTDLQTKWIIEKDIIPYFKNNDFENGILNGLNKILSIISKEKNIDFKPLFVNNIDNNLLAIFLFFIFWGIVFFLSRNKSFWEGPLIGFFIGLIFFQSIVVIVFFTLFGLFLDFVVSVSGLKNYKNNKNILNITFGSGSNGWFGGRGSGSIGGFGGFGGGNFGGGGSSGKW